MMAAFAAALGIPIYLTRSPPPPISLANGTYFNPCCGNIVLKNGLMSFSSGSTKYHLTVIKTDLQADTDDDVVISNGHKVSLNVGAHNRSVGFWLASHRNNSMNIYDAAKKPPDHLTLYGSDYSGPYDFSRVSA